MLCCFRIEGVASRTTKNAACRSTAEVPSPIISRRLQSPTCGYSVLSVETARSGLFVVLPCVDPSTGQVPCVSVLFRPRHSRWKLKACVEFVENQPFQEFYARKCAWFDPLADPGGCVHRRQRNRTSTRNFKCQHQRNALLDKLVAGRHRSVKRQLF